MQYNINYISNFGQTLKKQVTEDINRKTMNFLFLVMNLNNS